jgi:hypothetical protein
MLAAVAMAVAVLAVDASRPPTGGRALTFSFDGEDVSAPIEPAAIRRRTISPEFDPPLALRAGRVVFARGSIACDPGEVFRVDVVITQDGVEGTGRGVGRCTGEVQQWTATVAARGGGAFMPGPADACATATTRFPGVTDTHTWCATPVLTDAG